MTLRGFNGNGSSPETIDSGAIVEVDVEWIHPGAIALTVMPWPARSTAIALARAETPPLLTVYGALFGSAADAQIDEIRMMLPPLPAAAIRCAAAWPLK